MPGRGERWEPWHVPPGGPEVPSQLLSTFSPRRGVHQTQLQAKPSDPSQPRPPWAPCWAFGEGQFLPPSAGRKTVPELTQVPSARPHRVQGSGPGGACRTHSLWDSETCSLSGPALLPPRLAPMATTASRWQVLAHVVRTDRDGVLRAQLRSPFPLLRPSHPAGSRAPCAPACAPAVEGQVKSPQGDPTSCPPARPAVAWGWGRVFIASSSFALTGSPTVTAWGSLLL